VPSVYDSLNKAWKSTCRVVLGSELGELEEYTGWLREYMMESARETSHLSGKEVALAGADYCKTAKFVSMDEAREKKIGPLSINDIKDIDSIISAVSEQWEYCGNKALGNSAFVESSDAIADSTYVSDSTTIQESSYVHASSIITTNSRQIFGSLRSDNGEFAIRCVRCSDFRRCFETRLSISCSDLYFCATCMNSHDLLFSFNQRNQSYRIGNLQLPKEKYCTLKKKILEEVNEELIENKRFPSIFELVPNEKSALPKMPSTPAGKREQGMETVERAFRSTCRIIFNKEPGKLVQYERWLSKHAGSLRKFTSPFGHETYSLPGKCYPIYSLVPDKRMVSDEETLLLGDLSLKEEEITSLERILKNLSKIGYFTDEMFEGTCRNAIETLGAVNSSNLFRTSAYKSEYAAFNPYLVTSKYVFGGGRLSNSQFCINCYDSDHLNRCFELDFCSNCSDAYFSHNCEGLSNAMFCFNTKNKRHAVGNAALEPAKYRRVKGALLEQIAAEIEEKKELELDIFNVGCSRKN